MKKIYTVIILFCCLCTSVSFAQQQESLRDRLARRQQQAQGVTENKGTAVPKLSTRAEMMNESQTRDLSNATWIREIYRKLDLTKGKNAALLYPIQPIKNQMNFTTMIFKLMAEGNLIGYKWNNNGQELFTDNQVEDFGDVLKKLEIPFQQNGNVYVFDEFSIPSNEVLTYYVKEAWYFDQSNSALGVKTIAVCPVLSRQEYLDDDIGAASMAINQPLFWIPYESIRPYAAQMPIMASDLNNVMNKTINDYFQMRLYEGEIYKTTNMENVYLEQKFTTPESLKLAQDSIETQLKQFDKNLWVINDSINAIFKEGSNKTKNKPSKPKQPKSSSSGTAYSARDRR